MSFFCVINSGRLKNLIVNGLILCGVILVLCTTIFASGIQSTNKLPQALEPIYSGNKDNKNISLMINVYWGNEYIENMLQTLHDNNVKATFFVGGSWVKNNVDLFKKIVSGGHEIGNHGFLHKDSAKISESQIKDEIVQTNLIIKENGGGDCKLFAPPSGSFNQLTLKVAKDLGMQTILWSKDTIDWRDKSESLIYQRATHNVVGGDFILMHPTEDTMKALNNIITKNKENGFHFVSVGENLNLL